MSNFQTFWLLKNQKDKLRFFVKTRKCNQFVSTKCAIFSPFFLVARYDFNQKQNF